MQKGRWYNGENPRRATGKKKQGRHRRSRRAVESYKKWYTYRKFGKTEICMVFK